MMASKQIGYALIALSVVGLGIYRYNDMEATKKAAEGNCGCNKKVKLNAPPADSQVIQKGGCSSCGPKVAIYNPLYIHPQFDPNEYQKHEISNVGEPVSPYTFSPNSPSKRSLLFSNLGGGI